MGLPNQPAKPRPYFPHADAISSVFVPPAEFHEKSSNIGPVFDSEHFDIPIADYDALRHAAIYGTETSDKIPARLDDFDAPYLRPTLAKNERLRLTILWYYARHVLQDGALLQKLQNVVEMVKQFIGWDTAVVGLVDEAVYNRLATANMPVNIIPRREAMCAHTINQEGGTVFMVPSLLDDWRFENAPHATHAGMRSYAGTPLRLQVEDGEYVALGSLCVTSSTQQKPLTPDQKASLVRFGDIMVAEIVSSNKQARLKARQDMSNAVMALQSLANSDSPEAVTIEVVKRVYPNASVSIQSCYDNLVQVEGRPAFHIDEIKDMLWEDTNFIESAIQHQNFRHLSSTQTLRAVVARCGRSSQMLVVASSDFHHVFDDYDIWFVERCALALAEIIRERDLHAALAIKETFLRGITHQLRTPIHGVLASADLLAEELGRNSLARRSSLAEASNPGLSYIAAIRSSGRELMTTVNNVLKLNNWTDSSTKGLKTSIYDLSELQSDMLDDVFQMLPEEQLEAIALMYENKLTAEGTAIDTNMVLLKECVQSLVLNAIQACPAGAITVTISAIDSSNEGVIIDVVDTGKGICLEDQQRIFDAYEKVDQHTPGVGLGLTLARKIAQSLKGSLTLERSSIGQGSHFRLQFNTPLLACASATQQNDTMVQTTLPKTFCVVPDSNVPHMAERLAVHLEGKDLMKADQAAGSLLITDLSSVTVNVTPTLEEAAVIICILPSADFGKLSQISPTLRKKIVPVTGPFYETHLNNIMTEVTSVYEFLSQTSIPERQFTTLPLRTGYSSKEPVVHVCAEDTTTIIPQIPASGENGPSASQVGLHVKQPVSCALLVDDNDINLRILRMYCEKRHIPYLLARDGNEAITQYTAAISAHRSVDLVFMDLQMPNCDGLTACKKIRHIEKERNIANQSIMFIVTGQDSIKDRDSSFAAGVDNFLVKPVGLKLLDRELAKYFIAAGAA
ncbi:hypothetical protein LTR84_005182 [Exophiala bonariae]|uniref:histidine kinase n=1 Tax=Exophiala bonariae TaxID=1690606 RepID=A0AAV9NQR8_9EURO|nr:hypothetical protein LTR84_005182 [Exophiala bonariae]